MPNKKNIEVKLPYYQDLFSTVKVKCILCGEMIETEPYIDPEDYNYDKENSCHECGGYYPRTNKKD